MSDQIKNLFEKIPQPLSEEFIETLVQTAGIKIERIVSKGHVTPAGEWYDQEQQEWVLLLQGQAKIRFENAADLIPLVAGSCLNIPAHQRHRVEWTDPAQETIWLAVYFNEE